MIASIWRQLLVLIVTLALLAGCASTPSERQGDARSPGRSSGSFPVPAEIEDNVAFWRNVYGTWSRNEVAIHDDVYLGVIYEVTRLPGAVLAGGSAEQDAFVRARKAYWTMRLAAMEDKLSAGQSLTESERTWRDRLVVAGGPGAYVGASERVRSQRGVRERFLRGLEISGRYDQVFRDIMRSHGVPEDLAFLPHVESSFQPHARSGVGAAGVWQFMPATGRQYDMRVTPAIDERLDPVIAADAAARYLRSAYSQLGSWPLAITSYNHGVGGMQKAKALYGTDFGAIARKYRGETFGFWSRNFYASFIAAREVASEHARHFPEGVRFAEPLREDKLVLRYSLPATQVARHYGLSVDHLAELNLAWRDPVRKGQAQLPAGSTVWLPKGSLQRVAGHPEPMPVMVAQATPKTKPQRPPVTLASTRVKSAPAKAAPVKVAAAKPAAKAKPTAATKQAAVKHHVVKPNETLYRVALQYELSVEQLRRLNRMAPNDNTIRAGQRLRVSG